MVYHSGWVIVWLGLLLALPANAANHPASNRLPSKASLGHKHAYSERQAHHADGKMAGIASFYGNESGPKSASGAGIDPSAMTATPFASFRYKSARDKPKQRSFSGSDHK
jgi:hypothetical protein